MSLKTFLTKIWADIKSLFDSIPQDLKTAVRIGITVTENIKTFVDSPAADVLTAIIPGEIDDFIKDLLRGKIPAILTELKLTDNCGGLNGPSSITACAVKTLQGLNGDIKSAFLHNISILTAQIVADGKLSWSDGVYILEWYYQHQYKNAESGPVYT